MKKNNSIIITLSLLLFFSINYHGCNADEISEELVVSSALMHYPKILLSQEKINISQAKLEEATGEFDTKLNVKQRQFTAGYYEGDGYLESKVVKPLSIANANVYGGYNRTPNGIYPELNQYYNTKTNGRALLGVEFSLLRGFLVNERSLINKLAKIDVKIAQYSNKLTQAQIVADAKKAYWKFVYARQILKVYEDILEMAMQRQKALIHTVKNGDKAKIILQENHRTILRRMSLVEGIKRELRNNAVYLSFYLRDKNGDQQDANAILNFDLASEQSSSDNTDGFAMSNNIKDIIEKRLDVQITQMLVDQYNFKTKFAKNDTLPTVDLAFEASKDFGNGPKAKDVTANKIALNITVPIENNKQSGKYHKAKSDSIIAKTELKFLKDSIANEIQTTNNKIHELIAILKNTQGEIEINKKLVDAENIRFKHGDSDFFVLNLREQDLLYSMEYELRNKMLLNETLIEYNFITKDSIIAD